MNNLMLDLETLGTKAGSIVLSIGAVLFDDTDIDKPFHVHIDHVDSTNYGLTCDPDTAMWWISQSQEAQRAILKDDAWPLIRALSEFRTHFEPWPDLRIWCNGAAFDFPILKAAYNAAGMQVPWKYHNEMDFRTIKGLFGKEYTKVHTIPPTLAHDALADAVSQAKTLQWMLQGITRSEWLR